MADIEVTIGTFTIPTDKMQSLKDFTEPIEVTKRTLDGTLYTDFTINTRKWEVAIAFLCKDDYDDLKQVYLNQYNNAEYPTLSIPFYDVDIPVKMSINEKDIKLDGDRIVGINLTLEEQYPVS